MFPKNPSDYNFTHYRARFNPETGNYHKVKGYWSLFTAQEELKRGEAIFEKRDGRWVLSKVYDKVAALPKASASTLPLARLSSEGNRYY
jgi:hypothetical protein